MTNIKSLIVLFISFAIVLSSCEKPGPGYRIHRRNDTLLFFLAMSNTSEIIDAKINNNELHIDIGTGIEIEKGETSLQQVFNIQVIEPDERLKIQGTSRINGYGVVHLKVSPPNQEKKIFSFEWNGSRIKDIPKEPGPFANSNAFRFEDEIISYCVLPDKINSSWKTAKFGYSFQFKRRTANENLDIDSNGNSVLNIETINTDPDIPKQHLSFLLVDLQHHETVEVKDQINLGEDIYVVYLKVVSKKNQNKHNNILSDR